MIMRVPYRFWVAWRRIFSACKMTSQDLFPLGISVSTDQTKCNVVKDNSQKYHLETGSSYVFKSCTFQTCNFHYFCSWKKSSLSAMLKYPCIRNSCWDFVIYTYALHFIPTSMFSISLTELSSITCAAPRVNAHFLAPVAIVLSKISILSGWW